jgi:hypothetical protein
MIMDAGGLSRPRALRLALGTVFTILALTVAALGAGTPPRAWAAALAGPDDGSFSTPLGDLQQFIRSLQGLIAQVTEWVQRFRQTATNVLSRMIWESPGLLPDEVDLTDLMKEIQGLPATLRGVLDAIINKLRIPPAPGSTAARHHAYIESNPALIHEATGIAETDELVAVGTVRQATASQATTAGAAAVSQDLRPAAASADAWETSSALASAGQNLPSSRAGIELLVSGIGAGLRQQADLGAASADRLSILVHQIAQVSQQVEALGATMGAWTLRQAERDRRALDSQLGLADTAAGFADTLQDVLAGAGDPPGDEPRLQALY